MPTTYIKGDATRPQGDGQKIIAHICNDVGAWGAGFVLAISRRWKDPERQYRLRFHAMVLGDVQFVRVDESIVVANMIAQRGISRVVGDALVNYEAIASALRVVAERAKHIKASIHMPRIGCGLGGGTWDQVEPIIITELAGLEVTVYDLP